MKISNMILGGVFIVMMLFCLDVSALSYTYINNQSSIGCAVSSVYPTVSYNMSCTSHFVGITYIGGGNCDMTGKGGDSQFYTVIQFDNVSLPPGDVKLWCTGGGAGNVFPVLYVDRDTNIGLNVSNTTFNTMPIQCDYLQHQCYNAYYLPSTGTNQLTFALSNHSLFNYSKTSYTFMITEQNTSNMISGQYKSITYCELSSDGLGMFATLNVKAYINNDEANNVLISVFPMINPLNYMEKYTNSSGDAKFYVPLNCFLGQCLEYGITWSYYKNGELVDYQSAVFSFTSPYEIKTIRFDIVDPYYTAYGNMNGTVFKGGVAATNASITCLAATGQSITTVANLNGDYFFNDLNTTYYTCAAFKDGDYSASKTVDITAGSLRTENFYIEKSLYKSYFIADIYVKTNNASGDVGLPGADVSVLNCMKYPDKIAGVLPDTNRIDFFKKNFDCTVKSEGVSGANGLYTVDFRASGCENNNYLYAVSDKYGYKSDSKRISELQNNNYSLTNLYLLSDLNYNMVFNFVDYYNTSVKLSGVVATLLDADKGVIIDTIKTTGSYGAINFTYKNYIPNIRIYGEQKSGYKDVSGTFNLQSTEYAKSFTISMLYTDTGVGALSGIVSESGNVIPNFKVIVKDCVFGSTKIDKTYSDLTDVNGEYGITGLVNGSYCALTHDSTNQYEYTSAQMYISDDTEYNLTLTRLAQTYSLHGVVRASDTDNSIPDATVAYTRRDGVDIIGISSVITDSEGGYELSKILAGKIYIHASKDGYITSDPALITIPESDGVRHITLKRDNTRYNIQGVCYTRGANGVLMPTSSTVEIYTQSGAYVQSFNTNSEGVYSIWIQSGDYNLVCITSTGLRGEKPINIDVDNMQDVKIVMGALATDYQLETENVLGQLISFLQYIPMILMLLVIAVVMGLLNSLNKH